MTTATEPTCGDRVLAVIGYAIAASMLAGAVLVWFVSAFVVVQFLYYAHAVAGVGTWLFAVAGVVPVPLTLALGIRCRAWRDAHRLATVTIAALFLAPVAFYVAAVLGLASSLGGY